jgi:hypothetical protein
MGPGMFDGLGTALAIVAGAGVVVAGGIGYSLSFAFNDDVSFDFNDSTKAAIEEQSLTTDMICNELIKGQNSVIEEFNDRGISVVPTLTMSKDECMLRALAGELTTPRP